MPSAKWGEDAEGRFVRASAESTAKARVAGLAIAAADGYIAAIATANGLAVATQHTSPFEAAGATVINPWQA